MDQNPNHWEQFFKGKKRNSKIATGVGGSYASQTVDGVYGGGAYDSSQMMKVIDQREGGAQTRGHTPQPSFPEIMNANTSTMSNVNGAGGVGGMPGNANGKNGANSITSNTFGEVGGASIMSLN